MIRVALPLLVCVIGCGRLEFGEVTPDGAIGHDEDGDGIGDATDRCPHIPGSTADSDGDGVGDACDPNPTTPGDRITVFSGLTPGTSPFDNITGFTEEADGLRHVGDRPLRITRPVRNTRIEIGFDILAIIGTGQHQVAVGAEGSTPYYFTELNESNSTPAFAIVSFDPTNGYLTLDTVTVPAFHTGRGMLRLDTNATTKKFGSLGGWDGELYMASAGTPMFNGGVAFRYALNGVDIRINYIIVIDSP